MPGKLYKIQLYLKRIMRKQDRMWKIIKKDYQNTLKIQSKTTITYNIMLKYHTNIEHIFGSMNRSYDAIIEVGKEIKKGKRIMTDMRGIMTKEGENLWEIKLEEHMDNINLNEITKTMSEVQQKLKYQNELISKTSSFIEAEKVHLKDNLAYISTIGSNSKVPNIQKNLEKARRYVSTSLDTEETIKARLEETDIQLAKINRMSTSTYDVEMEEQIINGERQEEDDEMKENSEEKSVNASNRNNNKDEVSKDKSMNQIEMVLDPKECRSISEDGRRNVDMGTDSNKELDNYEGNFDCEGKCNSTKRENKKRKAAIDTSVIETEDEARKNKVLKKLYLKSKEINLQDYIRKTMI